MKKSEAKQKLLEFYERKTDLNGRVTMEELLNFCTDELGMLPPLNNWSLHTDGDNANPNDIRYRTWEPEDD